MAVHRDPGVLSEGEGGSEGASPGGIAWLAVPSPGDIRLPGTVAHALERRLEEVEAAIERGETRAVVVRLEPRPGAEGLRELLAVASEGENGWMALARAHARLGLEIGARTGVPHWRGERPDLNYMLAVLEQRDGRAPSALLKLTGERSGAVAEDDWEPARQVVCD